MSSLTPPTSRRTRAARRGVALATVALLALSACSADADGSGAAPASGERIAGGEIIFAADQELTGFNYNTSKDSLAATRDVIENLFYFAVKARPDSTLFYEGLEGEPEVISEDPHVVEWTVNELATWSDGTPVTTDDIEFYYQNMVDPDNEIASRAGYEQIAEFEAVDDRTFRATFGSPYGDFRGLWQAIPQAAFVRDQPGGWSDGLNSEPGPSAGPYMFDSWNRGESLTLVPNPEWRYDPAPTLDRLIFRFLPESASLADAMRNGEVHLINVQGQVDLQGQLAQQPNLVTDVLWRPAFEHLVLNLAHPVVGELAVRQALAHALDRDQLVDALVRPVSDEAQRLDNLVFTDITAAAYQPNGEAYHQRDLDQAAQLLEDAGWLLGDDGVREKAGTRLSIQLTTTAGNPRREQGIELIRSQLSEVGIEAVLETDQSGNLFGERLPQGQFQVVMKAFTASPFPIADASARFVTGGGDNYGQYSNDELDRLAAEAATELDPAEQQRLGNAMDELLWEGLTMIPLFQVPNLVSYESDIVGVDPNGTREGIFWNSAALGRVAQ